MSRPDAKVTHFAGGTNMRFILCPGVNGSGDLPISGMGFTLDSSEDLVKQAVFYITDTNGAIESTVNVLSLIAYSSTTTLHMATTANYSTGSILMMVADADAT
jgi:hypothetical protein